MKYELYFKLYFFMENFGIHNFNITFSCLLRVKAQSHNPFPLLNILAMGCLSPLNLMDPVTSVVQPIVIFFFFRNQNRKKLYCACGTYRYYALTYLLWHFLPRNLIVFKTLKYNYSHIIITVWYNGRSLYIMVLMYKITCSVHYTRPLNSNEFV